MLNEMAANISFFGIFLTGMMYVLAIAIQKRFKSPLLNPLLVACVIIIVLLLIICTAYLVDGSFNPFLYFRF